MILGVSMKHERYLFFRLIKDSLPISNTVTLFFAKEKKKDQIRLRLIHQMEDLQQSHQVRPTNDSDATRSWRDLTLFVRLLLRMYFSTVSAKGGTWCPYFKNFSLIICATISPAINAITE